MKRVYFLTAILSCLLIIGHLTPEAVAVEAYFDTEISTDLEVEADYGTLIVRMMNENVPAILQNITYEQELYVEIIFDASKTMKDPDINGVPKINIAKKLISILATYFPQTDTRFALRVNGARYPNNCLDSEVVVPFSKGNGQQILDAIRNIQPKGLSPLTYSIRQVLKDFDGKTGSKVVFLITDGMETCDVEPSDTCTTTMDMLIDAEFDGTINILGINTLYDDAKMLLSCLSTRGKGNFLDSNRNHGEEFAQLIRDSSQLRYNISRIFDPDTLQEGKILGLINRRIGDVTELDLSTDSTGQSTDVLIEPGIIGREESSSELEEIDVIETSESNIGYSSHQLPPGIYKITFITEPPMISYLTIDEQQELTIGIVRSGMGFDLYGRVHLALGNRYYEHGQIEQALTEYQKVLDLNGLDVNAHLNMGIIYHDLLKDNEKAAEHYKIYLELQGPRQEEVSLWLREVRGLPTKEEELGDLLEQRKETQAREEAARLAEEERARQEKERQKALGAYEEIRTANPPIKNISPEKEEIVSADQLDVVISSGTPDFRAEEVALDIGKRMVVLLDRHPEIIVYREGKEDVPVKHAVYDEAQGQYVILE